MKRLFATITGLAVAAVLIVPSPAVALTAAELQEQIERVSMRLNIKPVQEDAQKMVDILGGKAVVRVGDDIGAVCYYITLPLILLILEKL